jgi:hypothetical protein
MDYKKKQKEQKIFSCIFCDFNTGKKCNYNKHLTTAKHLRITNDSNGLPKTANNKKQKLECICGKVYKNRQGLYKHTKKCNYKSTIISINGAAENPLIDTIFVIDLIKKNQELQDLLVQQNIQLQEQSKQHYELVNKFVEREPGTVNNNNNTTNNNNQKFNLNFFLNETCKDAMNIQEFIETIKITFQELLTISDIGFVGGVSDIFVKQLRNLDITKRPIHCTDVKRDTIFLKEEDTWNKDDKENTKLKNIIEKVEYKNIAALHQWCNENPDSKVNNTTNNLLRDKIYMETLQGDERTRDKIIKNISKEIIIDKET